MKPALTAGMSLLGNFSPLEAGANAQGHTVRQSAGEPLYKTLPSGQSVRRFPGSGWEYWHNGCWHSLDETK